MTVLLSTRTLWECPNCPQTAVTSGVRAPIGGGSTQMHQCAGLRGLLAPLVPAGTRCKVEAVERQDYVGDAVVQTDPERGRPVMSVVTTRDDGTDAIVFPDIATARVS